MDELESIEIKAFIPARDFDVSKQFYQDIGFTMASDNDGIAYFVHDNCSFLLQDFYDPTLANNFMMHLLVKDVEKWHEQLVSSNIIEKYSIKVSEVTKQPWGMLDYTMTDPCGVLWRVAQNI